MSQPSKKELAVYGYIRCYIHSTPIIPNEIKALCYDYYGHFNEYIDIKPDNIKINDDEKDSICCMILKTESINSWWSSCYGAFVIDCMDEHKYEWIFKINKLKNYYMIGLIHSENDKNYVIDNHVGANTMQHTWQTSSYSGGSLFGHNKCKLLFVGKPCKTGDINKMELNISKSDSYLKFYHNDNDLGKAFENIKPSETQKYRLGISFRHKNDSISLLSFLVDGK